MNAEPLHLSAEFKRLYCDPALFEPFSAFHPVSFTRLLPFQSADRVIDDPGLLQTEEAHLAGRDDATRSAVVDAFVLSGLLPETDAANLIPIVDYFDVDFFEFMGSVYANAGIFICALRWYREFITHLETNPRLGLDDDGVYASVGYCLYSLGLFPEAILWSRSCLGPGLFSGLVCDAVMNYEAQRTGGALQTTERVGFRTRYTASTQDPPQSIEATPRLKQTLTTIAGGEEFYIDWVRGESPGPEARPDGYPFKLELDASSLPRHKMNLLFAIGAQADVLAAQGFVFQAKQLLLEAALLEPGADFIREKLSAL